MKNSKKSIREYNLYTATKLYIEAAKVAYTNNKIACGQQAKDSMKSSIGNDYEKGLKQYKKTHEAFITTKNTILRRLNKSSQVNYRKNNTIVSINIHCISLQIVDNDNITEYRFDTTEKGIVRFINKISSAYCDSITNVIKYKIQRLTNTK